MENDLLKVAVVQMSSVQGDYLKNREIIKSYVEQASVQAVNILVTPELSNVGYNLSILKDLDYSFNEEVKYYGELAQKYKITLAIGLLENEGNTLFNVLVVIDDQGKLVSKYRKINLFPLSKENEVFGSGVQASCYTSGVFKFGLTICYDIRFPELFRTYLENDCNALIVSSAFPFSRLDHWITLLKAHAIMNQSYVIASNRSGTDGKLKFAGNSCIIDPWGNILSLFDNNEEGMLVATLDSALVHEVRNKIPAAPERLRKFPLGEI